MLNKRTTLCHNTTCPICLEPLDMDINLERFTICNHGFHNKCWTEYVERNIKASIENAPSQNMMFAMIQCELHITIGPHCPLCRTKSPMIHDLAYNWDGLPNSLIEFSPEFCLKLASSKDSDFWRT